MSRFFLPPDWATQYRAIGLVCGQYLPSLEAFEKGVLLTDDGKQFPAVLFYRLARRLDQHPEQLDAQLFWSVWPQTIPDEPRLFLELNALRSSRDEQQQTRLTGSVNYFSIRGVVVSQDASTGKLAIRIERNKTPRPGRERKDLQPFDLEIEGFLPSDAVGQFWDLDCCRNGDRLVMEDAHLVTESPPPIEKAENSNRNNSSSKRTKTATKPGTKQANAPLPNLYSSEEIMPTPGKMELTIKINQFPVEVKTVANNWKQFNVEAGDRIVSIVVKPKVFKKLEQAQENYPQWVASITGQIGETTEKGFVLKEPSIQVFEKKPKESKESTQPLEPKSPKESTEPIESKESKESTQPLEPKESTEPIEPIEPIEPKTPVTTKGKILRIIPKSK